MNQVVVDLQSTVGSISPVDPNTHVCRCRHACSSVYPANVVSENMCTIRIPGVNTIRMEILNRIRLVRVVARSSGVDG